MECFKFSDFEELFENLGRETRKAMVYDNLNGWAQLIKCSEDIGIVLAYW